MVHRAMHISTINTPRKEKLSAVQYNIRSRWLKQTAWAIVIINAVSKVKKYEVSKTIIEKAIYKFYVFIQSSTLTTQQNIEVHLIPYSLRLWYRRKARLEAIAALEMEKCHSMIHLNKMVGRLLKPRWQAAPFAVSLEKNKNIENTSNLRRVWSRSCLCMNMGGTICDLTQTAGKWARQQRHRGGPKGASPSQGQRGLMRYGYTVYYLHAIHDNLYC